MGETEVEGVGREKAWGRGGGGGEAVHPSLKNLSARWHLNGGQAYTSGPL